jgi:hypothetical protein
MFMSHHQTARLSYYIKAANKPFENVAEFKYLGMMLNQSCVVKSRLNLGIVCYHAVQNLLFSHLLSKNVKIKIYKTYKQILLVWVWNVVSHVEGRT